MMTILLTAVLATSIAIGVVFNSGAALLAALLGVILITLANPVLWAAFLRVREHDRAVRRARIARMLTE
jgi:hypothetical protein